MTSSCNMYRSNQALKGYILKGEHIICQGVNLMTYIRSNLLFSFFILLFCFCRPSFADNLLLGGFTGSTSGSQYGYIGAVIPINSTLSGEGFRLRLWANYLTYEYDKTSTIEIEADGFGTEAAVGYKWNFDQTHITGYVGGVYRDIDLDPDDPSNSTADKDFGLKLHLHVVHDFNNVWSANVIGNYTTNFDTYWTRFRPGYKLSNGLIIGPEITLLGGEVWDKQKIGAYVKGFKLGNVGVGLNAGVERAASESGVDPYVGISLSTVF